MGPARLCGARRGLVRSARALAAAALLALSGALALPATAQADVLVSNIGQTSDATATVGFGDLIGQVFTVASGGGNYTLTSIEVPVELLNTTALTAEDIELLSASLWSADEFGAPGSSLQALTNPSSISDGDTAAFTDPAGTTLEAGKLYAVMFVYDKSSAELAIKAVRSNDEDGESLSGWTIYNSSRFLSAGNTLWQQDSDSLQIRVNGSAAGGTPSNNAPVFSAATTTRTVAENSAEGTNVGAVIPAATDADSGDTLTYSMEGTDAASFAFDASTRQITTITGVTYNHEATKNSYSVTVKASDGTASATIAVTIDVTDVNEKSAKPDKPTLAKVTGSSTSLTATWTKPDLNGGPDIATYIVQYREGTTGVWTTEYNGNALTTTITGLTADTSYQVQVQASNGELFSDWSDASDAVKTNAAGTTPTITAVAITSTPVLETDTYGQGERIEVTVTFSEAVNATDATTFVLSVGGTDTRAPVLDGSGTTRLVFSYTVRASDGDDNGIWIGDQDRTLVGDRMGLPQAGAITSVATSTAADLSHSGLGTDADHKVDGSRSIVLVAVSSTPMLETDTYGAGETIRFKVTFSSGVSIGGSPVFRFSLGNLGLGRQVDAAYESGAGSAALVFGYTVVSSDEDDDGIWIGHQGQTLVGTHQTGTITIVATSEAAAGIEHDALGVLSGHKVDGSRTTGNNAPVFTSSASLSVEENTLSATVAAVDNDTDDDITDYAITGGTDVGFFSDVTSAGLLTFDEAPNFEDPKDSGTDNTYVVTVEATSGTGTREMTATQTITVTVTDADEKSAKPAKPTLAAVTASSTSLTATWTKPDLDGGPEITGYEVQYREGTTGDWEDFAHTGTAVTTTVTGLTADTSYQVQVRAKNGETDSDWSDASDAVKTNAEMSTPSCTLNTGDLWCGAVTVALHTVDGFDLAYGFVDASATTNTSDTGALSDETFSVGSNNYTIDGVTVGIDTNNGQLNFSLTSDLTAADKEKLVVHVGSRAFAFDDVAPNISSGYKWALSGLDWSSETSVTLRLREANNAPVFADDLVAITLPENSAVGTSVGAAVTATDADSDTLTYSLEGTDAASFDIESGTGQIKTKSGVTYDFEAAQNTYEMTVKADDGNGGTDTIEVNIALLDADEKSAKPDKPTLAAVAGSSTSLTATWEKPDLDGGPDIAGYDLQYREGTTGTWEDFAHSDTAVTTTITGLTADTSYQVQVRAKNGETDSDWSDASDAVKTNAEMSTPTCTLNTGDLWCGILTVGTSTSSGTTFYGYDLHESQGSLSPNSFMYDGNTITVTGLQYDVGSGNALRFDFTTSLGTGDFVLHVGSQSFDFTGGQASYSFTSHGLSWSSGNTVEVRLREAATAPGEPTDLTATANGTTRIDLSWTAPADDGGSAITGYRIEVSTDAGSNWSDLVADTANTDTTYSHTGLSPGDTRHYRVSAINAEGASVASDVADATTAAAPTCALYPDDLWCGVVTVERFPRPPLDLYGFGSGGGDLSDKEFTYGTNSYTIDVAANERNNGALLFSLTSALTAEDRAALELHVDGNSASFAFSDANHSSSDHTYTWPGTGLDWLGTLTVTLRLRAATETDATLRALSVTRSGGVTVPLRPAFAPGTGEYRAWVANRVDEVTVAATANVAAAEVAYLDGDGAAIADADTNTPGREVVLEVGATVVEVKVTAEDGTTMRTYRVTVTRSVVDDQAGEGEFRLAPETVVDYADPDNDRHGGGTGPVEVYHAGAWGTVCRDGIRPTFKLDDNNELIVDSGGKPLLTNNGNEAAALICKAMNYDDGEYHMKYSKFLPGQAEADHQVADYWPPHSSYPADGPKPIWLDDLRCVAGESALGTDPLPGAMSHCSYAGWGLHNCTHKEDAVVRCWNNDAAGAGLKSLKGRFVSPPERHDGTNRVKVRVAFSEPVEESPENVGAHGVEVEGGEVTSVSPVGGDAPDGAGTRKGSRSAGGRNAGGEDREVVWEFEIEPDSDGDLTVTLEAGRPCGEPGAICTADGRALSEGISTTVEGPEAPPPLTASFVGLPEAHDGAGAFTFRVAFSENIGISYRSLREDAFAVSGGRVTRGRRVDDRRDLFEMTVEPDGEGEVTVTLPAGRECSVSGAICTKGENRRQLTNTPTATVAGPAVETGPAGLTARFARVPSEHDGTTAFKLRIAFSETIRMSGRRLRSDVVAVSGGRATRAGRVNRRKDLWKLKVRPDSLADVTVTLSSGAACDSPEAVCTKGEPRRRLTNTISATVRGPVAVSVADARAREGEDETIDFAVSLSRAASGPVTVAYRTADGTATAGEDYTRASGKLKFAPGETAKTVRVPVLDDVVDEGEETFRLRLLNASGARIADGVATGTIVNSDHLQTAWLSRFGRTVAGQVVDAVTGRLSGPPGGSQVTLGGQGIDLSALSGGDDVRRAPGGRPDAANDGGPLAGRGAWEAARAGSWDDPETGGTERGMTGRELLLGSSFHLAAGGGEAGGPGYAAWGRMSVDGFDGEAPAYGGTMRLDGEVTTGILGADAQWERWLAGVALSVSEGKGTFDQARSGTVESSLTSVNPYVRYEASDRLTAWGLVGYGTGDMTMTQAEGGGRAETVDRTDISMRLGAAGARGVLLEAGETGGVDLALRGDAFLVQMDWEKVSNETDTRADASRLRLLLEGGRSFALRSGAVLTPALELGLRHDGGDAETGTGVEVGGRIRYTDAGSGLTVEANARKLVAHEDSGYEEWGAGGSVRLDPGASGRGLSLRLAPVWGTPSSGVERLLSARVAAGQVRDEDFDAERRLEGELGYGFGAFGGRGVMTPWAGLGLAEAGDRTWRAGARWSLAPHLAISLDGARREPANDDAPEHGVQVRFSLRW